MSNGIRDAFQWLKDSDPIDLEEEFLFTDEEITEICATPSIPPQKPWLDFFNWKPPQLRECDCGARVCKTTCADWCSRKK